jgi:hypothetical protein
MLKHPFKALKQSLNDAVKAMKEYTASLQGGAEANEAET